MTIPHLIVEFEQKARSQVGEFFGIDKERLTRIPIKLIGQNGTGRVYERGTGLADENGISFNQEGMKEDLKRRTSYGIKYTLPEYVKGLVFEEVAHHLETKQFGHRGYEKLIPFHQILFDEMFSGFGIALAGVLDKEVSFRKSENGNQKETLKYYIDHELENRQPALDSYNNFGSRLNPLDQIRLRKPKHIVEGLQNLSARGNLGSYETWRDFYSLVYPKGGVASSSHNGMNVAYLYARLLADKTLKDKQPVQPLLRLSYPQLEQKLTPALMSLGR